MDILHIVGIAWSALLAAMFVFVVFVLIYNFRKATSTLTGVRGIMDRLVKSSHDSEVFLWGYFQVIVVAIVNGVVAFAQFIGQPELASAIQQYLTPKTAGFIMLASVAVTLWARSRRTGVATITAPLANQQFPVPKGGSS